MNKKVGILTWHYYENVGSNLQAFALMKTIKDMGFEVEFINYQRKELHDSCIKTFFKTILAKIDSVAPKVLPAKYTFKSFQFQKKHFKTTKICMSEKKLNELNKEFDIFVCGSDQIWSPLVFNRTYFLNFVDNNKYKFSYAPSIGNNYLPDNLKKEYHDLLINFNGISVREEKGRELLEEIGIEAKVVLDPTFLLKKEEWIEISKQRLEKENYLFCYFLGENYIYRQKIQEFAKKNNIKLIIYSAYSLDEKYCDLHINKIGPEEFLSYIRWSEEVFTDSFHGVVFSLKFEKKFNAFYRFKQDDKKNQNSRIINILGSLNLKDRIIGENQILNEEDIDYNEVNKKLEKLISESKSYLREELNNGCK